MRTYYNRFAGQSLERLAALSDGVFAVAMTLLVLDIGLPVGKEFSTDQELLDAVLGLWTQLLPYLLSFMTMGIFWVGQQTQLNHFSQSDRNLAWIHLGFLFA